MEEWEHVSEGEDDDVWRLKVPGGWLYRVRQFRINGYDVPVFAAMSVTFVPDAERG